jgi:hypothetical protein
MYHVHAVLLACRDDLIFLIYLYQRWIYRVDMTRVNEFGFSGQQAAEVEAKAAAEAANGTAAAADGVPAIEVSCCRRLLALKTQQALAEWLCL